MTETEALVTAARHYLAHHIAYWTERYARERTGSDMPYTYSDSDYNLFPRYNVLSAILAGVETFTGNTTLALEECRSKLVEIGNTANNALTSGEQNAIEQQAITEERDKFIDHINNLNRDSLVQQEPLPYRRRLDKFESKKIRKVLQKQWGFNGDYWDPLEKLSPQPVVFLLKLNITDEDYAQIIAAVHQKATDTIYEIDEDGNDAEVALSSFHPDCYETIYCDAGFEWIVYGSHESTVTFGGNWLIDFVNHLFKDRKEILNYW